MGLSAQEAGEGRGWPQSWELGCGAQAGCRPSLLQLALWLVFRAKLGSAVVTDTLFPATLPPQPLLLSRQQLGPAQGSLGR